MLFAMNAFALLLSLIALSSFAQTNPVIDYQSAALAGYQPSVVSSREVSELARIATRREKYDLDSCYHRAQVWTYEFKTKLNIHAMKVFIFYGDDYTKKAAPKWWYHVVPVILLDRIDQPKMIDYFFGEQALELPDCVVVKSYSEYDRESDHHPEKCFMLFSSPYYVVPGELEAMETEGYRATEFDEEAVRKSFKRFY